MVVTLDNAPVTLADPLNDCPQRVLEVVSVAAEPDVDIAQLPELYTISYQSIDVVFKVLVVLNVLVHNSDPLRVPLSTATKAEEISPLTSASRARTKTQGTDDEPIADTV